ncbi:MAG TPA: hypothetical protein VMW72_22575, partial [Sedimentisphaerales bacterium]|nr:hypothetical protein [Sedimentisphaerales bacterium]
VRGSESTSQPIMRMSNISHPCVGTKLRAYPNNRVVMRPSEKFEAKAAGQKCSEAWFSPR